jgi:hypothetical protein
MKTNEAPEKIYVHVKNDKVTNIWNSTFIGVRDIEYTCTDAFIDKAWDWLTNQKGERTKEDFIKAMKGE